MNKFLIATTNKGKYRELARLLAHVPIEVISLDEIDKKILPPEESENSIIGNAILKAQYYAAETGYITIADDGGLFIDALRDWPGVRSARIADTSEARMNEVLERLEKVGEKQRGASFRAALACVDPKNNELFVATGKTQGIILTERKGESGFGYDPIFYVPHMKKTYAEMTEEEKNSVSHRGKAMIGMKRYILNTYGGKHYVVPIGIVVRDGKILLNKRNDQYNPDLHGLWEFPGGGMEIGETVEENLIREVQEECGYEVRIISLLRKVWTIPITNPKSTHFGIHIYLIPYVCTITAGDGKINDTEVLETVWAEPEKVETFDLIGENRKLYEQIFPELIQVIQSHDL